jgi:ABC-type nitrate/sulfonate/bicarbonate transport system ATPase subunit
MLELKNISLKFEKTTVIDSLSYNFEKGKVYAITGESGVGKTSLLNMMAGLLNPSDGAIKNNGEKISFVFQEPRLFEWMTALENVSTVSDSQTTKKLLTLMELEDVKEVYDKEGAKKREEREQHILNCIDGLTKDLPDGVEIDVPVEFQEVQNLYV